MNEKVYTLKETTLIDMVRTLDDDIDEYHAKLFVDRYMATIPAVQAPVVPSVDQCREWLLKETNEFCGFGMDDDDFDQLAAIVHDRLPNLLTHSYREQPQDGWPCQDLLGGDPKQAGCDWESGMCHHEACNPKNDDRTTPIPPVKDSLTTQDRERLNGRVISEDLIHNIREHLRNPKSILGGGILAKALDGLPAVAVPNISVDQASDILDEFTAWGTNNSASLQKMINDLLSDLSEASL
jgi:hypothetical protein